MLICTERDSWKVELIELWGNAVYEETEPQKRP